MKHISVPSVSPFVKDLGASGPPVDEKGDLLSITPMERPSLRHSGALGAMTGQKVVRPVSTRPDPHRPTRKSMVMSRYAILTYFTCLRSRSALGSL